MVMRIIIYTGKGGVGKTSVSAATAIRLSEMGYKTLLMSTDSAHSLGDSLDLNLSAKVENIGENLDALEIDIIYEMRTKWADISEYVTTFLTSQGLEDITAEEMAVMPGMEMVAALFYVLQFEEEGKYDVIVMDTAPTGETLRLLSFPDISNWYMDRFYSLFKRLISIARTTVSKIIDLPLPSKAVMKSIDEMKDKMVKVKDVLENPDATTIRLVLNPERMAISETRRTYTYTCLTTRPLRAL